MTDEDYQMQDILCQLDALGVAPYDAPQVPRTQKEAEARVWQCLLYTVSTGFVEEEIGGAYNKWTPAQQQRWQKAEVNVCKQLLTRVTKKAERVEAIAVAKPSLFGGN